MADSYSNRVGFANEFGKAEGTEDSTLQEQIDELKEQIREMSDVLSGLREYELDAKGNRVGDVVVPGGKRIKSGDMSIFGLSDPIVGQQFGFMSVGKDLSEFRGYDLTEVISWYDETNGLSAFYGRGGPIVVDRKASTISGSTTISSDALLGFDINELAGKIVTVSDGVAVKGYVITANSDNRLTIDPGTPAVLPAVTTDTAQIEILNSVYLGAGSSPWKRAYVERGTGGGLRFGLGSTGNTQNGLLYASGNNLYYRRPSGTTATLA